MHFGPNMAAGPLFQTDNADSRYLARTRNAVALITAARGEPVLPPDPKPSRDTSQHAD
jgi:hypothetical protein